LAVYFGLLLGFLLRTIAAGFEKPPPQPPGGLFLGVGLLKTLFSLARGPLSRGGVVEMLERHPGQPDDDGSEAAAQHPEHHVAGRRAGAQGAAQPRSQLFQGSQGHGQSPLSFSVGASSAATGKIRQDCYLIHV
jgi:hypothetical protein